MNIWEYFTVYFSICEYETYKPTLMYIAYKRNVQQTAVTMLFYMYENEFT